MENVNEEIWKDIIGYEGHYQISNLGNVKSIERKVSNGKSFRIVKEMIRASQFDKDKYHIVNLCKNKIGKCFKNHRLVAIHFIPNPKNLPQVNHIDGNKTNNHFLNLEWVSNRENSCHRQKKQNTSSKYIGVHFNKSEKKWFSRIKIENKTIHLGYFKSEEEAYKSRVEYEKKNNIINKYL